jgi:hypothetical protein
MINHKEGASNRSEIHPFREIDAKAKSAPWQPGVYQYTYQAEANRRLSQLSTARGLGTNFSGVFEIHAAI